MTREFQDLNHAEWKELLDGMQKALYEYFESRGVEKPVFIACILNAPGLAHWTGNIDKNTLKTVLLAGYKLLETNNEVDIG